VLDDDLAVVAVAEGFLRHMRFGCDGAESTTKSDANSIALFLRWCPDRSHPAGGGRAAGAVNDVADLRGPAGLGCWDGGPPGVERVAVGYYEWLSGLDSPRRQEDALLLKHLKNIQPEHQLAARARRAGARAPPAGEPEAGCPAHARGREIQGSTAADARAARCATRTPGAPRTW
jgi:hypothetical protein